ncbi:MAG: ABC transporter permease [Gemmatimonadota bacterium]|nr:ABC transporter permease [Gemmatimonadota bacterium]
MAWYHRLFNTIRSDRHARDLEREVSFHLRERTEELRDAGMTDADAAAEARRRFGNRTVQQERSHDAGVVTWLESALADVRYAVRSLVASPGFALVAILSLGLGIGANTAIFSLTNAVLLKSLPVRDPAHLVNVYRKFPGDKSPQGNNSFTNPLWEQIRADSSVFSHVFAYGDASFNLAPGGEVRMVDGAWVSGDFFQTLGLRAESGRLLDNADDVRGCTGAATVSDGFAVREFGSAAQAVGKVIALSGHPFTVTGVVDASFSGIEVGHHADVYAPICAEPMLEGPKVLEAHSRWYLFLFGRPKPGLSPAQVDAGLATAAPGIFAATVPEHWNQKNQAGYRNASLGAVAAPTGLSDVRDQYRSALYFLLAAVGVVLLIACANIANLLLARGAARQRELSIRMAIGAGRRRVVRQLFTESLVVAVAGAAAGVLFAHWAARLLVGFILTDGNPVALDLTPDLRVLGFTAGVAILTALLFGLIPAWRATRVDPQAAMKAGGRGVVEGDARYRAGRALVVGQVALSLGLVAVAALLLGSFRKLISQDPGFDSRGVLVATMDFSKLDPSSEGSLEFGSAPADVQAAQRRMVDALRATPGVQSAAAAFITPASGIGWNDVLTIPGYTSPNGRPPMAFFNQVSDGYFATMHSTVLAGRVFTEHDGPGSPLVAVVNEAFARQFFGTRSPLGRTYQTSLGDHLSAPVQIVGVVSTAKYASMSEAPRPTIYVPLGQGDGAGTQISFVIRGGGDPHALVPAVKRTAAATSPSITLSFVTLDDQISRSLARPRLVAMLSGFFGVLAILLAVIGLYGTMSYLVTRRRNEIGIRMALGAAGSRVLGMIVSEAGRLVVLGLLGGLLLAAATTRYIKSFLFHTTPTDPRTLAIAVLLLGVVAMGAALLPAWRAARVDPMDALREE